MKKSWRMDERSGNEKPWWNKIVWLFVAFAIAGAIRVAYKEVNYKKEIPIERRETEWQTVGTGTMEFGGQSYPGDVFFDRLSLQKEEGKITLWVKIIAHSPVIMSEGKDSFNWDEQISRWVVNCETKEIMTDYSSFFLRGKKQYGGKIDDLSLPIVKGTISYSIYEMFCF